MSHGRLAIVTLMHTDHIPHLFLPPVDTLRPQKILAESSLMNEHSLLSAPSLHEEFLFDHTERKEQRD